MWCVWPAGVLVLVGVLEIMPKPHSVKSISDVCTPVHHWTFNSHIWSWFGQLWWCTNYLVPLVVATTNNFVSPSFILSQDTCIYTVSPTIFHLHMYMNMYIYSPFCTCTCIHVCTCVHSCPTLRTKFISTRVLYALQVVCTCWFLQWGKEMKPAVLLPVLQTLPSAGEVHALFCARYYCVRKVRTQ